jgi:PhzF family phenazine biosynthesis protein
MRIYQVDAFTDKLFTGNPAAVCPLDKWLPDEVMQSIALENNLSETAFYVKNGEAYEIRWFTPTIEVDLCGHATLATAFVLFFHENHIGNHISLQSHRSGSLAVSRQGDLLTLDFPVDDLQEVEMNSINTAGLNISPLKVFKGRTDYVMVYQNEDDIRNLAPDFIQLATIEARGIIVTAPGHTTDFVSRFFGPNAGVNEDPVTGSAHTSLTPYWAKILGKKELTAEQLSFRGGSLNCKLNGDRVEISGKGRLYLKGEIAIT